MAEFAQKVSRLKSPKTSILSITLINKSNNQGLEFLKTNLNSFQIKLFGLPNLLLVYNKRENDFHTKID
jgi:hypothetical protein